MAMEVQFGPNSVDEPNLLYKLQRKIKVFNTNNPLPNRGYNLVASSSKYGVVFVGSPDGTLCVYYLKELVDSECEPKHFSVRLQEKPTHIAVSCDQELLAVTGGQQLSVYKVADFQNQNVSPSLTLKCDVNPSTFVSALQWNPCIPDTIAIAFYDGTLLVSQVATSQVKKVPSKARCLCWSPKGKQLVTGNSDGTLSQYKPDLTPAKTIPAPNLFEGAPVEALAVYWISTFQFAVVYRNAADNSRPAVTIVNTPKAGKPSCWNYEDICYSMGTNRPWYYYLHGFAQWNIILLASSNSMEMATLGSADGVSWMQWCQPDEARPELPLTDKKQENYPIGVCVDTSAIHQLPWGENSTLPHMPLLHVVSQTGLLTIFNIINLSGAPQVCSPPQQIVLPAAVMTSEIPGEVPVQAAPVQAPTPDVQPKPQSAQPPQMVSTVPPVPPQSAPTSLFGALTTSSPLVIPKPGGFMQPPMTTQQIPQGFAAAPTQLEQKLVQPKSIPAPQLQSTLPQSTHPVAQTPQTPPQALENAALKAEQERLNEMKANQELKNILVKEVNDFQVELYKFTVKTRDTQIKLQRDIDSHANFSLNTMETDQVKKDCSLDELRGAIVQLKLELVRACAVVAEARTHAEAKDYNQWTQADPLTTKRVASVKKLAYYVQTQLDQAQRALDFKWSEVIARDPKYNKPGQRMIRPILDDVYQPLVKQQEILGRQQAVLRTLKNTLNECDVTPMFKSTSLLRNTPLRNKDPLSKLTKNILNMSIDTSTKTKEPMLSAQKLDALRDMLSNHKTVKIKPVNVEMREHLASLKQNYAKSMREKTSAVQQVVVKREHEAPQIVPALKQQLSNINVITVPKVENKFVPKQELVKQPSFANISAPINVPSFSPVNNMKPISGLPHVARTLFTEEPKQDPPKPKTQQQPVKPTFSYPTTTAAASPDAPSVLKDILQAKQTHFEPKKDSNMFMGQPICSPSSFSFSTPSSAPTTTASPSNVFASKPISGMMNMFSKFQPEPPTQEPKLPSFSSESKTKPVELKPQTLQENKLYTPPKPSNETGEPDTTVSKTITLKPKTEKPLTNLFGMKTATPLSSSTNVPDVLKSTQDLKVAPKALDKEKAKENEPEKDENVKVSVKSASDKKDGKPLIAQVSNKSTVFGTTEPVATSAEVKKPELKVEVQGEAFKVDTPVLSASSIFAVGNAASPTVPKSEMPDTQTKASPDITLKPSEISFSESDSATSKSSKLSSSPSAASIFGAAVASQPKTTTASQAGSIFAAAAASSPQPFSSTQGSIFGTASTTQSPVFGATTTQAVFSTTSKPSVFSTPTPASPTSTPGSIFGSAVTPATSEPQSPTSSAFGSSSASSVFGTTSSTPSSAFGSQTSSTQSAFGGTTTTPSAFTATTTQASVFSSTNTTQSIFGSPTASTVFGSSGGSVFASQPSGFGVSAPTTQSSVFGATPTTQASVFGTTPTTQASVFGTTPTTQASVFGTTPTTQASVFGTTPTTQASVFGTTPITQTPVFGTTPATQASVFGSSTPTTQSSIFGSTPSTQSSIFGSTPAAQPSVFGTAPTSQASVFGTAPTTQASVFGTPVATTAQSGSIFGGAETNLFASASISTTSAPSQSTSGSIFGSGSNGTSGSVFGSSNTNVFGGKAAFGQPNPTAAAIFGGGGATSFGQKPASNFWSGGNTTGEGGFGSTGFGQQPTTQASSIFGGGTGGSFSTPSPAGQAFGSPQQGGAFGGGDNKPSVFGTPQQQSSTAFGGSPVFGNKPVFGQSTGFGSPPSGGFGGGFGGFNKSPGFGGSATFGGSPAFGGGSGFGGSSPGQMFGSPTQPNFAQTQSNATFENLATQNTLTFGNLAQQSGQQPQQAPSFNTSPSFSGWRG